MYEEMKCNEKMNANSISFSHKQVKIFFPHGSILQHTDLRLRISVFSGA